MAGTEPFFGEAAIKRPIVEPDDDLRWLEVDVIAVGIAGAAAKASANGDADYA
jgi:hypothetical protein